MCCAPEGCQCNTFVLSKPVPASPKRFAEMTGAELRDKIYNAPSNIYEVNLAALRDAIRTEALEETSRIVSDAVDGCDAATIRAERAERDARTLAETLAKQEDCTLATAGKLRTAESALGEARRGVVQDFYNRIAAMDATGVSAHKWVLDRQEVLSVIREYPATPSGEGVLNKMDPTWSVDAELARATPSERVEGAEP